MELIDKIKSLNLQDLSTVLISTTAKESNDNRILPSRAINGEETLNLLLNSESVAEKVITYLDDYIRRFIVDVERKQAINLWSIARKVIKKGVLLPYKPNDITVESAYHLVSQYFNYDIADKSILLCGSGNIATKLALRLAEYGAKVSISGRNDTKVHHIVSALNMILPAYSQNKITAFSERSKYDVLVSALSVVHEITPSYLKVLNQGAFVVDVGINNLAPSFIQQAQGKSISIMRLDVRIGAPIIGTFIDISTINFYKNLSGQIKIKGINCISGGIIGKEGDIIINAIHQPTQVIGIANGTGGMKKYEEQTERDTFNIKTIETTL